MSSRLARAIPALVFLAAIGSGCSSSSTNTTAPVPVPGPNFNYAFPGTGTSLTSPGTSNKRPFTITEVGSWDYRCQAHATSGMTGTVVVDTMSTNDSQVVSVGAPGPNPGNLNFVPKTVTIKPGGYVRWVNVSSMTTHTVSRP